MITEVVVYLNEIPDIFAVASMSEVEIIIIHK